MTILKKLASVLAARACGGTMVFEMLSIDVIINMPILIQDYVTEVPHFPTASIKSRTELSSDLRERQWV
jgi:hypothetical protein